ncbi:MAG TPA: hypothetical protein VKW76_00430 [Candidatus Binatia bacterium]|nr:hypothetical protein [Candidatus Binatia bacterium]
MRNTLVLGILGILYLAAPLYAQEHPGMVAAQQSLESAKASLKSEAHDYAGHRAAALVHVNKALAEVAAGLKSVGQREKRVERKVQRLEKRQQRLQQ